MNIKPRNRYLFPLLGLLLVGGWVAGSAVADDDDGEKEGKLTPPATMQGVEAQKKAAAGKQANGDFALYKAECGTCHTAFPARMLPAKSWEKMMGNLADHFGDNAELPADKQKQVTDYLVANAATRDVGVTESLRITETRYFVREHREVPAKVINHPEIKSLSNCAACHTRADAGSFREGEIKIPGVGRWED